MSTLKKLFTSLEILSRKSKVLVAMAAILRIGLNFLDFAALAVVGVVAYLAANSGKFFETKVATFDLNVKLSIGDVPWLAVVAAALFLLKSFAAIVFSFQFGSKISQLEAHYARKWIENNFEFTNPLDSYPDAPQVHTTLMRSISSLITGILTSLVTMLSEGALLLFLITGFMILNPFAATLVVAYLGAIVFAMSFLILPRIHEESTKDYAASHRLLTITRDYLANKKAIMVHGENKSWLEELSKAKALQIASANRGTSLASLPRNLIETALILGVFGFLGLVVVFSDIPSQAVTIGIFLVGGLRLVSAILPLQAAVGVLKQSLAAVDDALLGLKIEAKQTQKVKKDPAGFDINVSSMSLTIINSGFELNNISVNIPFGSKFAIVGPSGAGKTTLGELILGLRHPTRGEVQIGGVPATDLVNSDRHYLAHVPQQPQLIDGTLAQNVSLSLNPNRDSAFKALELAGLSHLVDRLPFGVDSSVAAGKQPLSGGELQRLGLARALYTNAKVIVLDEATSALDAATEEFISGTLRTFHGRKTLVVIAHRLSTIVDADCILYLDKGRQLGLGTYEELLKSVPDFLNATRLLFPEPQK